MRSLLSIVAVLLASLTFGCDPAPRASAREITDLPEATTFYLHDHTGSPVVSLDRNAEPVSNQARHAYGTTRAADGQTDNPHGYLGLEEDDEGLLVSNGRPYDPARGAFLSPDPVALFEPQVVAKDARRGFAYAYSASDPVNLKDDNGKLFDIVLDVASAAYDVYRIVADNVFGNKDNLGENMASLGADVAGAAIPFVTGGGVAVRAATHADDVVDAARGVGKAAGHGADAARGVDNAVPKTLARVVPGNVKAVTLGRPGTADVFVTAADDIAGMNAAQIAERLAIPPSSTFSVIEFATPARGLASPILRTNPGFVGRGLTAGGAREFALPNGPIPAGAVFRMVGP